MLPCCRDCCGRKKKNDDEGNIYSESRRNTTRDHDNLIMHHHLSDGLPVAKYESLEYDDCFNTPYKKLVFSWTPGFRTAHAFVTWVLMFVIGFLTAMIGLGIDVGVDHLMDWKFDTSEDSVDNRTHDGKLALSLLTMMAFNVAFVFVATFLTTFEPYAAGSGIPEVKCYLNGVKMPNITRLKTLVVKAIGVLFSVAGGLFVGREGPMIHSGAVVAAGIPQFMLPQECYEKNEKCAKCKNKGYRHFRSDRMKRDFVSAGAAAGVAAAFGAPIGGVLFSLEEGSSFWKQDLTWKSLLCALSSTAVLNFFLNGIDYGNWASINNPELLHFGSFVCQEEGCTLWLLSDLFVFAIMGMLGGLLGAIFNQLNYYLTRYRILHVIPKGKVIRALEALLVAGVTTMVIFTASMTLGKCQLISNDKDASLVDIQKRFFCEDGYFNDMASLLFNGQESSIKSLFHSAGTFSLSTLSLCFFLLFFLACWTYGILVPSGLFVPSILVGAVYGRIWGELMHKLGIQEQLYPGSFALIGSAAFVGGVVRMTISLTVILIETTNEISYGLPIVVTLLAAKFVGDRFNIGLYDIHNEMKGVPFLEWSALAGMERLEARDVMETKLKCLLPHSTLNHVIKVLQDTKHNAFPVVTPNNVNQDHEESDALEKLPTGITSENLRFRRTAILNSSRSLRLSLAERKTNVFRERIPEATNDWTTQNSRETTDAMQGKDRYNEIQNNPAEFMSNVRFHGIILRSHLIAMLKNKVWYNPDSGPESQKEMDYWQMIDDYPRDPPIEKLELENADGSYLMDLSPYMKSSPYSVAPNMVVPKVFNFFRTMGLRHLPVINNIGEIVGIITRCDLTNEALVHSLSEKYSDSCNL